MVIKKILIVDDSPTERLVLTELLKSNGYRVIAAESGEQAIRLSKLQLPDLILMDVVMPGINGYEATRAILREDATRHIPIIMCTSRGQPTDKIWGMRQGAHDYMVKPLDSAALLAKIAALA